MEVIEKISWRKYTALKKQKAYGRFVNGHNSTHSWMQEKQNVLKSLK